MTDFERKYIEAQRLVQGWANKQGHDRCWYYPEIFRELVDVLGVELKAQPPMPTEEQFREGCRIYHLEVYNQGKT